MLETITNAWTELAQSYIHQALIMEGIFFFIEKNLYKIRKAAQYTGRFLNKFYIVLYAI
jgi:hypothetical protein